MQDLSPGALEGALQSIFGGPADQIEVGHIDQICPTLSAHHVNQLLRAVGGSWVKLLDRIEDKRSAASKAKSPGIDIRNLTDAERAAFEKAKRTA